MKQRIHTTLGKAALILALLVPIPAVAQESAGTTALEGNVKVTFRMGTLEDGKRVPTKTYDLIVSSGTSGSKLLSGARAASDSVFNLCDSIIVELREMRLTLL